eukprot:TRINITY_DN11452_c0_g1_i5.p4 TRINITY_DN11452_c0_g1~~TRINITY_DN11452_c0_g1_i5.p4  ORF type:complete len:191 (-),score=12.00 TRINITY_DN11452_c0_g1_i5:15-587(-)
MDIKPENIEVFNHENFVVTTANKPDRELVLKARRIARELDARYVSRRKLAEYREDNPLDFYYSVEKERLVIRWDENGTFFFHPSSSKMRMRNIRNKQRDYLIETLNLKGDETILDLTLGLGSEAILMGAYLETGKIIEKKKKKKKKKKKQTKKKKKTPQKKKKQKTTRATKKTKKKKRRHKKDRNKDKHN